MQPTPRLRVLSDRILRVLVFVYFCRGLSGNMKERPTRRVYIEILTCRAIFYHLEESGRTGLGAGRPPSPLRRPPWYKHQSQNRVDRNAYIICYIWSSESRDINKRRNPRKRAAGLIELKLDFVPLRPMCIL